MDEKTHSEREDRMFQNNAYLRIGQMGQQGNTPKRTMVLASTSHKKPDGSYEDDFSGFVGLCGEAKIIYEQATAAGDPHPVIKMTDCGVTSRYDAATHKTYTNFMVFKGEYQPPKPKAQDNGQVLQQATPQQAPVTQQFVPTQAAPAIAALAEQSKYATVQRIGANYWSATETFGAIVAAGNTEEEDLQTLLDNMVTGIVAPVE